MVGGVPETNRVQRLSLSASGAISRIQDGPQLPLKSLSVSSLVLDKETRITSTGGLAQMLNGMYRNNLVYHLDTANLNPRWTHGPKLQTGRRFHTSFCLGNTLFVGMGFDESRYLSSLEMLDTTQTSPVWRYSQPSYPIRVHRTASVVIQGQDGVDEVWVAGGLLDFETKLRTRAVYSWRGPGYSWHREANMTRSRDTHSLVAHGGNIYAIGGWAAKNLVEMYHKGTWTLLSSLPSNGRTSLASVVWGNYLVQVTAYYDHGPTDSVWVMDFTSGSWSVYNNSLSQAVWLCQVIIITT